MVTIDPCARYSDSRLKAIVWRGCNRRRVRGGRRPARKSGGISRVKIVFMFPGQSSRYPELLKKLLDQGPENRAIVQDAADVLGRDLERDFSPANPGIFDRNQDIQVGVFLANYIHASMLRIRGIEPDFSLGLSLGEYNHLVDIGALSFEAGLRLVAIRGAHYDQGPEGAMAAVGPIRLDDLNAVIQQARRVGPVEIAVENSPTHHVIGGSKTAVEAVLDVLENEHFVHGSMIDDRIPMHTSLFSGVAEQFRPHLERAQWQPVHRPYLPNTAAQLIPEPSGPVFVEQLAGQVYRPVKWRQSIETIVNFCPDAVFVEVGPRAVLFNLLQSRWIKNRKFKSDGAALNELDVDAVVAGLRCL
jgi:[acyl-carrier-protein] S-malonyltransferase